MQAAEHHVCTYSVVGTRQRFDTHEQTLPKRRGVLQGSTSVNNSAVIMVIECMVQEGSATPARTR